MARLIPAGEFVGPGEELTARTLEAELPDHWVVICNKVLVRDGTSREVDFIVVGQNSIFVVDEKNWHGAIHGDDKGWVLRGGRSERSPIDKVEMMTRRVAGQLRNNVPRLAHTLVNRHFAYAKVLLSADDVACVVKDSRATSQVVKLGRAAEEFELEDSRHPPKASITTFRDAIVSELVTLRDRPRVPKSVNEYEILEILSDRGATTSLLAKHEDGTERILHLIEQRPTLIRERAAEDRARQLREYQALKRLADLERAPAVSPYFFWSDEAYLVVPVEIVAGQSLRTASVELGPPSSPLALDVCADAFQALAEVHAEGMLHRNLSPDSVFFDDARRVRFTDFSLARLPDSISFGGKTEPIAAEAYVAPEVRSDLGRASAASDVYSLAASALFWLGGSQPAGDRPWTSMEARSAVEELLGTAESDLLGRCLAADAEGRPSSSDVGDVLRTAAQAAEVLTMVEASDVSAIETTTSSVLAEGDRVDDRYEIVCELGRGATGITYLALDDLAEQEVVLKSILDRESIKTLSTNEYKRLYELRHPGLPRVDHVFPPGSPVHLKLEYIQGRTLEQVGVACDESIGSALRVAREVGDVLRYLDERGLVHRDINPSNIMIPDDSDRPAVLLDFGLAAPTSSETSVGTPRYRDPEIDRGQPWTPAADLYSLGCVLFELTTGRLPYSREPSPVKDEVLELSPAERERLGDLLASVLSRAVEPDPRQRYPSVAEFLAELVAEPAATEVAGIRPSVDADGRRIIAGRYVLLPETMVSGGAADVYRAIDLDAPEDPVAVKVIRNTPERDRLVDLFFKREFGSLQELHHPNVIRLLDGGFDEVSHEYYLALEWMPTTLTALMADRERVDWEWLSQAVALPLASALSAAHARQVIHRDVKPSNVLVTKDGVVKLADFGISVLKTNLPTDDRTLADQRSAPYSPPEREYASDATRDVYGFGVLVIECLSGRRIADYPEIQDALDGIVAPEPVFDLLRRCVSTDPDERPRNGLALEAMLQQAIRPTTAGSGTLGRVYCQLSSSVLEEKLRVAATTSGSGTPLEFVRRDLSEDVYVRVAPRREGDDNKRRLYLCGQRWSYLAVVEVAPPRLALIHGRAEEAEQLDRDRERGALAEYEFKIGQSADDHRSAEAAIQQLVDLADLQDAEIQEGRAERDERRLFAQWAALLNALWDIETKQEAETRYRNLSRQGNVVTCVLERVPDEDLIGEDVVLVAGDTHSRSKRFRCVVTEIRGRTARLWLNGQPTEEPPSRGFLRIDVSLTIKSLSRQRDALNAVRFGGANVRRDDLPSLLLEPASSQASVEVPVTRWLDPDLDDSKKTAVRRALGTRDFLLVQGPPGTGKTTLIAELVGQELRQNPDCRILLTSQTHVALDNALEALERTLPSSVRLTRLASREGQVADGTRHLLLERQAPSWRREVRQRSDSFIKEYCEAHGIGPVEVRSSVLLGNLRALRVAYDANELALAQARLQVDQRAPKTPDDPETSAGIDDVIDASEDSVERLKRQVAEVASELGPLLGIAKARVQSWSLAEIDAATQPAVLDDPVKGRLLKQLVSLQGSWLERVGRGDEFDEALLRASSVVAATCVGLAGPPAAQNLEFDVCIVDEASIATATQALVPFVRSKRWILVGDPNQLPPFQEHALTNPEYQETFNLDQETLKTTMFDLLWSGLPEMNKTVLTDQYRMTKPIGDLISTVFYGGLLNSVRTGNLEGMQLALPKPATWLDTSGLGRHHERSAGKRHTSFDNPAEAEAVVDLLRRLEFVASASGRTEPMSVLVLAGYAAQVGLLRDQIATVPLEALRAETNTIDAAQGREADIVVLSVVRSNDRGSAGFLRERSRINVALSRARWGLVVVGDAGFCSQHEGPLQDVLAYMDAHPDDCAIEALSDA